MLKNKKAQATIEFVVLLFFVAPIAINLINYFSKEFLGPFVSSMNSDMQCMVRYGYSCVDVGIQDTNSLTNYKGSVPVDVQSMVHPLDKVQHDW